MKGKRLVQLLTLLIAGSLTSAWGCAPLRQDYVFGVSGVVTTEDDTPLAGAEVTLDVRNAVYAAITPIRTERRLTSDTGGFVFIYNSPQRGVKYNLTIRKEGFETMKVSGVAPPSGHHSIRLKETPDRSDF